ncbi:glycosyltransferase [Methylobacterium trifolii]|uniref:D-inositol-3-phosphate glycosyltransferase n=1 Tax=Methylobacterium trifolii TaxID=1003092 RepID=A0ABQ4U0G2_9HYPH|nr:glycosyltransferase [Methylobacterium trifolii]GJE60639.1 D-inositol-3-phosphate glycosyltransferase [Methylobacterium trifolii]
MPAPRVMFVNHTSTMSGAELVLADAVEPWPGATAFLFEGGPLNAAMASRGLSVTTARGGGGLSGLRRDSSPLGALPVAGRLVALVAQIARAARVHDVVYANSQKAFVLSALATTLARRPLVWHLHDILDSAHFGAAQRALQVRLANACARLVIVPSRAAADAFVAAGGRAGLVEVVPNGLSIDLDLRPRAAIRRDLGLPDVPMVGVFSRLAAWKGQHVVLRALADLPGIHAVVAGDALFGEGAYADGLRALAAELGVSGRVHFLGQRSDVPRLMQAMDVVIHPSVHPEPFGRTLVEAMLAGVPVVATDTGAAAEILDGGRFGTLVPPDRPDALADAVADILAHRRDLEPRLAGAAERARTHYGVAAMRTRLAERIGRAAAGAAPAVVPAP